jgi:hypothetical protein
MKKILGLSIIVAALSVSAFAADSKYEIGVSMGTAMDNFEYSNGSSADEGGFETGVSLYKKYTENVSIGMEMEAAFMDDYESYSLEMNGKYNMTKKLAIVAGISYNYYDVDGGDEIDGLGAQVKVEYDVYKNVGVYTKYKFVDLEDGVDYSNRVSAGVNYKF